MIAQSFRKNYLSLLIPSAKDNEATELKEIHLQLNIKKTHKKFLDFFARSERNST